MAPSPAYYVWIGGGKPFTLMRPARALQATLQGHGLTVYAYPNEAHQRANLPEDHTAYSATGWPGKSAYGVGHAIDIMPRTDNAAGRAENAAIARRLIADRNAGVPGVLWIKYLNWTDEKGVCRQERWMPDHTTRSSTDRGHIHISGRSDCDDDLRADTYDPIAPTPERLKESTMQMLIRGFQPDPAQVWLADGMVRRKVKPEWVGTGSGPITNAQTHQAGFLGLLANGGAVFSSAGDPDVWGVDVDTLKLGQAVVPDAQVEAIAERAAAAVVARDDNPLGEADKPALIAAFKQAAAEGTGG